MDHWWSNNQVGVKIRMRFKEITCEAKSEDIVKSEEVSGFRIVLQNTGFGFQVRIYYSDGRLYDSGLSKNTLEKGMANFDSTVAALKKQMNVKD